MPPEYAVTGPPIRPVPPRVARPAAVLTITGLAVIAPFTCNLPLVTVVVLV